MGGTNQSGKQAGVYEYTELCVLSVSEYFINIIPLLEVAHAVVVALLHADRWYTYRVCMYLAYY